MRRRASLAAALALAPALAHAERPALDVAAPPPDEPATPSAPSPQQPSPAPLEVAHPDKPGPAAPPGLQKRYGTSVGGVRASYLATGGTDQNARTYGLQLAGHSEQYELDGDVSMRGALRFGIGGGTGGFEGELGGSVSGGLHAEALAGQGPFLRVGIGGQMLGNKAFYLSYLELPELSVGWQARGKRTLLELAVRAGPVLAGRYNAGDTGQRKLGEAFETGGHASLHLPFFFVTGSVMRVHATQTGTGNPVDIARADACFTASGLAICGDSQYTQGDQHFWASDRSHEARSLYVGVLLGFTQPIEQPHR